MPAANTQQPISFGLGGGLDLVSPAFRLPPGRVIAGNNYEAAINGYRRMDGYERFDGRPSPSAASYWSIPFSDGTYTYAPGEAVTGGTSGATGRVLVPVAGATGFVIVGAVSGTFVAGEALLVGGINRGTVSGDVYERGAADDGSDAMFLHASIDAARALIAAVPGSGPVRGVWSYKGDRYAFRDNPAGTAGVMWKATSAGWVAQPTGRVLFFTAGLVEVFEGSVLNGQTSGATGTVKRVVKQSGSWGSTAKGFIVFASHTGTFGAETLRAGATAVATIAGNSTAQAFPPGGRYRFVNHNFYGASNLRRMYGCNGVGQAFEWDGTTLAPVITGMPDDRPTHIAAFADSLWLGFPGGSLQFSSYGAPLQWQVVTGAGEIGLGQDITGLLSDYLSSLVVFGRNKVATITGTSSADFALGVVANDAGAIEWTAQKIGKPLYFDDSGLRDLTTTSAYGNFNLGTLTQLVRPLVDGKRKAKIVPVASLRVRAKDQYRLFYADGSGFTCYMGKKAPEIVPFDLGGLVVSCTASAEDEAGDEILLAGGPDGMVYELDAGTSFDGEDINAYVRLPFNSLASPTRNKRYHKAVLEIDASAVTSLGVIPEYSYVDSDQPPATSQDFTLQGGGGFWNEAAWNQFYWSAAVKGRAEAHIDGEGTNISLTILSTARYEEPHVLQSMTIHYSARAFVR